MFVGNCIKKLIKIIFFYEKLCFIIIKGVNVYGGESEG